VREFLANHKYIRKSVEIGKRILVLPVMLPVAVIMTSRKIVWTSRARKANTIGVLGRGISLKGTEKLSFLKDFIVVNFTKEELNTKPIRTH